MTRIALAALAGTIAYFAYGFVVFGAIPSMKTEFNKYPHVYRKEPEMMKKMPLGMIAILVSIAVVAFVYARIYPNGGSIIDGLYIGALIGLFVVCTFVIHNYVNLDIGVKLTVYQAFAYFSQWLVVGAAMGLVFRPR